MDRNIEIEDGQKKMRLFVERNPIQEGDEMERTERKRIMNKIEMLLNANCRRCPEGQKMHDANPTCQNCPILAMLQEEGRKFGGVDKSVNISKEQFAIAAKNGIKPATVSSRVYHRNWPVEKAITKPTPRNGGKT